MSTSVTANRIYARGHIAAEDLQEMAPDTLLLRGCKKPTQTKGGIWTPEAGTQGEPPKEAKVYVRTCALFEVVKLPAPELQSKGNPLNLKPGDVIVARNVLVDPLFGDELGVTDMYMGVQGVAERGPEVREEKGPPLSSALAALATLSPLPQVAFMKADEHGVATLPGGKKVLIVDTRTEDVAEMAGRAEAAHPELKADLARPLPERA